MNNLINGFLPRASKEVVSIGVSTGVAVGAAAAAGSAIPLAPLAAFAAGSFVCLSTIIETTCRVIDAITSRVFNPEKKYYKWINLAIKTTALFFAFSGMIAGMGAVVASLGLPIPAIVVLALPIFYVSSRGLIRTLFFKPFFDDKSKKVEEVVNMPAQATPIKTALSTPKVVEPSLSKKNLSFIETQLQRVEKWVEPILGKEHLRAKMGLATAGVIATAGLLIYAYGSASSPSVASAAPTLGSTSTQESQNKKMAQARFSTENNPFLTRSQICPKPTSKSISTELPSLSSTTALALQAPPIKIDLPICFKLIVEESISFSNSVAFLIEPLLSSITLTTDTVVKGLVGSMGLAGLGGLFYYVNHSNKQALLAEVEKDALRQEIQNQTNVAENNKKLEKEAQESITRLNKQVTVLRNKLKIKEDEIKELENSIGQKEKTLKEISNKRENRGEKIASLREEIQNLNQNIGKLKEEISGRVQEIKELHKQIQSTRAQLQKTGQKNEQLSRESRQLEQQMQAQKQEVDELGKEKNELKGRVTELSKDVERAQTEARQAQEIQAANAAQLAQQLQESTQREQEFLKEIQSQKDKEQTIEALLKQQITLQDQKVTAERRLKETQAELELERKNGTVEFLRQLNAGKTKYEQKIAQIEQEKQELEQRIATLTTQLESQREQIAVKQWNRQSAEMQKIVEKREKSRTVQEINAMKKTIEDSSALRRSMEQELREAKTKVQQLSTELRAERERYASERDSFEEQLENSKGEIEILKSTLARVEDRKSALTVQKAVEEVNIIADLRANNVTYKHRLEKAEKNVLELKNILAETEKTLASTRLVTEEQTKLIQTQQEEYQKLREELEKLKEAYTTLQKKKKPFLSFGSSKDNERNS